MYNIHNKNILIEEEKHINKKDDDDEEFVLIINDFNNFLLLSNKQVINQKQNNYIVKSFISCESEDYEEIEECGGGCHSFNINVIKTRKYKLFNIELKNIKILYVCYNLNNFDKYGNKILLKFNKTIKNVISYKINYKIPVNSIYKYGLIKYYKNDRLFKNYCKNQFFDNNDKLYFCPISDISKYEQ